MRGLPRAGAGRRAGGAWFGLILAFFCLFLGFELLHPIADLVRHHCGCVAEEGVPPAEGASAEAHGPFLCSVTAPPSPPGTFTPVDGATLPVPEGPAPDPSSPVPIAAPSAV